MPWSSWDATGSHRSAGHQALYEFDLNGFVVLRDVRPAHCHPAAASRRLQSSTLHNSASECATEQWRRAARTPARGRPPTALLPASRRSACKPCTRVQPSTVGSWRSSWSGDTRAPARPGRRQRDCASAQPLIAVRRRLQVLAAGEVAALNAALEARHGRGGGAVFIARPPQLCTPPLMILHLAGQTKTEIAQSWPRS
jgi:hypothetical protein